MEQKIVCPFHADVNPSMLVNLYEGNFYCFGCNVSGDAFKFVKLVNKELDDLECLKKYFEILKSKKARKVKLENNAKPKERSTDTESLDKAKDYFFGLKTIDWNTDLQDETEECYRYMKERGFNANILNKANAKITYNNSYPIIFPMFDNKEFKGWVCRTNDPVLSKKRKYLYNEGFSRSTTLVGNYSNTDTVVLCEGFMDMLKLKMFGIKKVAAILGWKVSENHIDKLKKNGVKYIVSALDNDECGKKGTRFLKNHFKVIRWQYLKEIKDPGEMNKSDFLKMYKKTKKLVKEFKKNELN